MRIRFLFALTVIACFNVFAQGSWNQIASMTGNGILYPATFTVGNKIFSGIGQASTGGSKNFYQYDPVLNTWSTKATFPGAANYQAYGFSVGNYGYIVCGQNASAGTGTNELWRYNPATNSWQAMAPYPGQAFNGMWSFVMGGYAYVGGGYKDNTGSQVVAEFYQYDPSGNSWTAKALPAGCMAGAQALTINGKGYIFNQFCGGTRSVNVYEYNPGGNSWATKNNFTHSTGNIWASASDNTSGFALFNDAGTNELWEYLPGPDSWIQKTSCPGNPQISIGTTMWNNSLFAISGQVVSVGFSNVCWKYSRVATPDICMVTVDSLSIYNEIYWDKTAYPTLDSMIIYREVSSNIYSRIGAVSKDSLSMFIDTTRSVGPANGNPNIGTYRYKIQQRDNSGFYSSMSPWHNTVFFINSSGTFFWNEYKIEGTPTPTNPMTQFDLVRDDFAPTGNYNTVGTVAGTQTTLNDPLYSAYQNTADWRVFAYGLNCVPSLRQGNNGAQGAVVKSRSNVKNNRVQGIKENMAVKVSVFPNPATTEINVVLGKECTNCSYEISNALGQNIRAEKLTQLENKINVSSLSNGVYYVKVKNEKNGLFIQKLVVQH